MSPDLHWALGLAYLGQGNAALARQEFQRIGDATETDRELRDLCMAVADLYEGRLDQAETRLSSQTSELPVQSGGLQIVRSYLRGRIFLILGKLQLAKTEADLILRTPEAGLQISDLLDSGILYARAGKLRKAHDCLLRLNKAWKAAPSSWKGSSLKNLQGEILLAENKPAEAERAFLEPDPRFRSHIGLAHAYQAQQRWDAAAQEWEKVLSATGEILRSDFPPDLLLAHLQLARAYHTLGDPDRALSHYQELLRLLRNADDIPIFHQAKREAEQFASEIKPLTKMFLRPSHRTSYTAGYVRGGECYEQQPVDNHRERDCRRLFPGTAV
jgi:tetratricopeptide (TPR) repeat protein